MVTRSRTLVVVILVFVVLTTAWSRFRDIDAGDHEPQRIRLDEHPAFRKGPAGAA